MAGGAGAAGGLIVPSGGRRRNLALCGVGATGMLAGADSDGERPG